MNVWEILGRTTVQKDRKKCDPSQLGKDRREHCSETMAKTGKINSYSPE